MAGFSDGVRPVSAHEALRFEAVKLDLDAYAKDIGVAALKAARQADASVGGGQGRGDGPSGSVMKSTSARLLASRWSVRVGGVQERAVACEREGDWCGCGCG